MEEERRLLVRPQLRSTEPGERPKVIGPVTIEDRFWAFFLKVQPRLRRPAHFRHYVARVLKAVGGDLRLLFAAPPQHGKTETTLALMAFLTVEYPGRRWAYITYNQKRANSISKKFKRLLAEAGVVTHGTLAQVYLPGGGQMLFTSVDGGITGEPVDGAAFIDDPYKNRKEANSVSRREVVDDTYRSAIEPRVHPGGSIFVLATRWHPDDLTGTLEAEGWDYINLQAIAEGVANDNGVIADDPNERQLGEALFPEMWPVEALLKKRALVLENDWGALYQGRPRLKGGKVYKGEAYYTELPKRFRGCFGVDLAFSAKTSSDWSVCLELLREDFAEPGKKPLYYVVGVDRQQVEAPEFALTLRARNVKRKTFGMHWRYSGTEKGSADFLRAAGLPIFGMPFPGDKLVCSQHAGPAWNEGRILVPDPEAFPECEEWLYIFLERLHNFTGSGGKEKDDEPDALANAFDLLMQLSGDDEDDPNQDGGAYRRGAW